VSPKDTTGKTRNDQGLSPEIGHLLETATRVGPGKCSTNTQPHETRWPALQKAGIDDLFSVALLSYPLGVRKDDPLFYDLVITAARCPPPEILFVGDRIDHDVTGPMRAGMRACLVRQGGLRPGELLPDGALLVQHVRDLPALVEAG
jgi:FMN phosphatase YigB (HAD superfamily)